MEPSSYTGKTLAGRYTVGKLLGEGGWGTVYQAVQVDLRRTVAVKILHQSKLSAGDGLERFTREARAAAALGHPHIAQVFDFQANPGEPPFIVMEYLSGASLRELLQAHSHIAPSRLWRIAVQALSALDVAHSAGIIHRDVKPDNLFLVSAPGVEDFVKLVDFGIAKLAAGGGARLTESGALLGTPAFMSPEQVAERPVDHRTDLYAIGATMYVALAGRLPVDASNLSALFYAILEQEPVPLSSIAPQVDPALSAIVHRALRKDPGARFSSAGEMRTAIEQWARQRGFAGRDEQLAPAAPPSPGPGAHTASTVAHRPDPRRLHQPSPGPLATPFPAVSHQRTTTGRTRSLSMGIGALLILGAAAGVTATVVAGKDDSSAAGPVTSDAGPVASAAADTVSAAKPTLVPAGTAAEPTANQTVDEAVAEADDEASPERPDSQPSRSRARTQAARDKPAPSTGDDQEPSAAEAEPPAAEPEPEPPTARKQPMTGRTPRISGGTWPKPYDSKLSRDTINQVLPAITACHVATEFDPPLHEFSDFFITVEPDGTVSHVRRAVHPDHRHPTFDACMSKALSDTSWPPTDTGRKVRVMFSARL